MSPLTGSYFTSWACFDACVGAANETIGTCIIAVGQSTRGPMDDLDSEWQRKGATLGDKTARTEFGLTQDEIVQAIRAGKLHYRPNSIFGNPFLRLLRREVEALVKKKHGDNYLNDRKAKTELAHINRELRRLKTQMTALEERKSKLLAGPGR